MPLRDEVHEDEQLIHRLQRALTECDAALAELRLIRDEAGASQDALRHSREQLAHTIASTRALLDQIHARQAELHRILLTRYHRRYR